MVNYKELQIYIDIIPPFSTEKEGHIQEHYLHLVFSYLLCSGDKSISIHKFLHLFL